MKLSISATKKLSNQVLQKLGFKLEDAELITQNLIDGELTNRKTHGLVRLPVIKLKLDEGKVSNTHDDVEFIQETNVSLLVNAKRKPAFIAIYKSLDKAIEKAKESAVVVAGVQNAAYCSGYIGSYAKKATQNDLIFIGFNNSPSGLVPHGAKKRLWGTDPFTVGVPTHDVPVILDMASSKVTFGDLIVAKQNKESIADNAAIDSEGNATVDPLQVLAGGGMLPIAGHKGSGLAFIIELLAGALTSSMIGNAVKGGWGTSYILINPAVFRPLKDFKDDVQLAIEELKGLPKADGVKEIYFAGEKSHRILQQSLAADEIEINDSLYKKLQEMIS
jgi:LDH2 family malate/lactate/ureidoglycolate dehydrogenase